MLAVALFIALGAALGQAAEKREEFPLSPIEIYVVGKLKGDAAEIQRVAQQLAAAQKAHDENLRAFIADAQKGHQIALKQGQTLGLTEDGKSFFVMDEVAPTTSR